MNNEKVCTMYISTFHLITILMPYIDEELKLNNDVRVISEYNLESEVKTFLDRVKNISYNKEGIKKLNWKNTKLEDVNDLKTKVIIIGSENYIRHVNVLAEQSLDCFKLDEIENINYIYDNYDKILFTQGKTKINKFSQNEHIKAIIKS